jgi:hypothetical protein
MIRIDVQSKHQRGWLYTKATGALLVIVAAGDDVWAALADATAWAMGAR